MPKKPKPATAGEKKPDAAMRLAIKFAKFPDGRIVYGPVWCEKLAKAIRSMNARAVKKERERCVWCAHNFGAMDRAISAMKEGRLHP